MLTPPREEPSSSSDRRRDGVCRRQQRPTRVRDVDTVYTDLFLDTFNYTRDWDSLWDDLSDHRSVLLVLSKALFDTVRRNENATVLRDGRCFITTPTSFDEGAGTARPPRFDAVVYFNVDPFMHAAPTAPASPATIASVISVVRTPFVSAFDRYMNSTGPPDENSPPPPAPAVSIVFNTFLLRTESVSQYERSRDLRVNLKPRVFPVHSYEKDVVCRTACNFCSDAVLLCAPNLDVFTVRPGQKMPTLRTLGPAVAESLFRPDRLVLLDVSEDRGGRVAANEYHRLKQFYFSFAHGRDNKWGLKLADDVPLQTYLARWNALMREEMRRWFWVLTREADSLPPDLRPTENESRMRVMQVYAMCPCILNAVDVDCDVCAARRPPPPPPTAEDALRPGERYVRNVLLPRYDTTTVGPGWDLGDRTVVKSLLVSGISINDELVVMANVRPNPSLQITHNKFFAAITERT